MEEEKSKPELQKDTLTMDIPALETRVVTLEAAKEECGEQQEMKGKFTAGLMLNAVWVFEHTCLCSVLCSRLIV